MHAQIGLNEGSKVGAYNLADAGRNPMCAPINFLLISLSDICKIR